MGLAEIDALRAPYRSLPLDKARFAGGGVDGWKDQQGRLTQARRGKAGGRALDGAPRLTIEPFLGNTPR
ncbi:hypothetical protein TRIP_E320003 [uncultured Spirochaetota bacterium]|nr:hypothetical protein TRIP_E320003 [uncultured Spirochaetota bacterium]